MQIAVAAIAALTLAFPLVPAARSADLGARIDYGYRLEIEAVRNRCSPGNPLYRIRNPSESIAKNVLVCKATQEPGTYTRTFHIHRIPAKGQIELGCGVEGGIRRQEFTIHWQHPDNLIPPQNPSNAQDVIFTSSISCDSNSNCTWWMRNLHHFKRVTVTYRFRNQTRTEAINPQENLLALGLSSSPPIISRAVYGSPYRDACLSGTDQYPQIPIVEK